LRQIIQGSSAGIRAAVPLTLLGGAMAVCAAVCWLLSNEAEEKRRRVVKRNAALRRDYFRIRKVSAESQPRWLLEGFGVCECSLGFDTWAEAMNQVRFRLEMLVPGRMGPLYVR